MLTGNIKVLTIATLGTCFLVTLLMMFKSYGALQAHMHLRNNAKMRSLFSIWGWKLRSELSKPVEALEASTEVVDTSKFDYIISMDQKDKRLWTYIKENHLTQPSDKPYNLSSSGNQMNGYSSLVNRLFNNKADGFFIEAGAYDGEVASNSLYFEKQGWKGLLVECNPILLPKLRAKNRKAWISDACLSPSDKPQLLNFTTLLEWPASAKLGKPLDEKEMKFYGIDWVKNKTWLNYEIPSFPLYSIIKAAGATEVDFLSLDVEGAELAILKGFPFQDMKIKVMIVEVLTISQEERKEMVDFMKTKGYDLLQKLNSDMDYVFALSELKL